MAAYIASQRPATALLIIMGSQTHASDSDGQVEIDKLRTHPVVQAWRCSTRSARQGRSPTKETIGNDQKHRGSKQRKTTEHNEQLYVLSCS